MYEKFICIIIVITFINSAALTGESKFIKRNGTLNKGLRLTRINVKQSMEIVKVYEADGSEISDDDINQQVGLAKFWPPQDISREASLVQEKDYSNQKKSFNKNRKSLDWKTTLDIQTQKPQPKINPEVTPEVSSEVISMFNSEVTSKFNNEVTPKFKNEFVTTKKEKKISRGFHKDKLKKPKRIYEGMKKGENSKAKTTKHINLLIKMKLVLDNFNQSSNNKKLKSGRFNNKSAKSKSDQMYKTFSVKTEKSEIKPMQNFPPSDKLNRGELKITSKHETKTFQGTPEKIRTSDKSKSKNKSHYKPILFGAEDKRKTKNNNIKKDNRIDKPTHGKTYTAPKTTRTTIQENNSLKPGEKMHSENEDANVADIIHSINILPFKLKRRVIDKILNRHHNLKRVAVKNSSASASIPRELNTTSVTSSNASSIKPAISPNELNTISSDRALSIKSASIPHELNTISSDPALSTISANLSQTYSATTQLPGPYSITLVDIPEIGNTVSEDLFEAYSTTTEEYNTPLVNSINSQEVTTFEENVSQSYEKGSSSEKSEKAKFNSTMLKEYSEIYIMPQQAGDFANNFDVSSLSEVNNIQKRSSNQKQRRQNFSPVQKGGVRKIRTKKNMEYFPKNMKDTVGTLYNYFTLLPQNKRRQIKEDIPSKVNSFFDKMSKPSTEKSSKNVRSKFMPVSITIKPRDIETSTDFDRIRMREFYYNDYDGNAENDVMDTLGDLSEEFAVQNNT